MSASRQPATPVQAPDRVDVADPVAGVDVDVDASAATMALASDAWTKLHQIFASKRRHFMDVAGEIGLTPGDMHALLSLVPGDPQPMRVLAEGWRCDASNVTWQVDRLEERGFTKREVSPNDRRVKTVVLTKAGEHAQNRIKAKIYAPPAELLELNDDVLEDLVRILGKVRLTGE